MTENNNEIIGWTLDRLRSVVDIKVTPAIFLESKAGERIRFVKKEIGKDTPDIFGHKTSGNMVYPEDIIRCSQGVVEIIDHGIELGVDIPKKFLSGGSKHDARHIMRSADNSISGEFTVIRDPSGRLIAFLDP